MPRSMAKPLAEVLAKVTSKSSRSMAEPLAKVLAKVTSMSPMMAKPLAVKFDVAKVDGGASRRSDGKAS